MGYRNAPGEPGRPSREQGPGHRRFGALCREERGQSLVVIVIAMTLIVLVAAVAIDVSDWFAKHHQAQVTADAAALAAANYMGAASAAGNASTNSATSTATTYAAANGLPISNNNVTVDTTSDTVTVTVPTTGSLFFAGISLGSGPSISARAVASWRLQDCSAPGSNCAFVYAADNVCGGDTGVNDAGNNGPFTHGITLIKTGTGTGTAITGDVISASSINASNTGQPTYKATAIYPGSVGGTSCAGPNPPTAPKPFANGVKVTGVNSAPPWPIQYDQMYAACVRGSSCVNGFPSYCTAADESSGSTAAITLSSVTANDVYCDAGTGDTSDPRTWNGTITVTAGGTGATVDATYIAGTVNLNIPSNTNLGPSDRTGNRLIAYGAECNAPSTTSTPPRLSPSTCPAGATNLTTSPAVYITGNGNPTISGDIFAPAGVIDSQFGGTPNIAGFLEGWDVVYLANGTVTGQGPPVNNQGYFVGDYLIQ